jgi:ribosomal protein S18 acetylase RimI-like enzyme
MADALPKFWRARVASCAGVVHEVDGLAVCLTGVPDEPFNPTLVEETPADPDAALVVAADRCRAAGVGLGIDLEPSLHAEVRAAAERAGFRVVESRPGMALEVERLRSLAPPAGVELRRVDDAATLARVAEADAAAFGVDSALTRAFLPDQVLQDPTQHVFAAFADGEVVGAGEGALADGVLGVFGIATVPAFRRQGVAAALTSRLIEDLASGVDLAVLQSSRLGFGVYERLGFREMSTWEVCAQPSPRG